MGNNAYVIDTSSLIRLSGFNRRVFVTLWSNVEDIIDSERLIAPDIVLDDLKVKSDFISLWAKSHRSLFRKITSTQLKILKDIENRYPQWIDPNSDKNQSDPYIIALALSKKREKQKGLGYSNVIVVTEESKDPNRLKIPRVCKDYGVESMNLDEFFQMENWKF